MKTSYIKMDTTFTIQVDLFEITRNCGMGSYDHNSKEQGNQ